MLEVTSYLKQPEVNKGNPRATGTAPAFIGLIHMNMENQALCPCRNIVKGQSIFEQKLL